MNFLYYISEWVWCAVVVWAGSVHVPSIGSGSEGEGGAVARKRREGTSVHGHMYGGDGADGEVHFP